jgi:hypothetical protein
MTVSIGTVNLDTVLAWEEDEEMTMPKKRIVRKPTPTSQAAYFIRMPRQIVITAKMDKTVKASLRALKNQGCWQPLYDYDDSFVDYVWIEKIHTQWQKEKDHNLPWVYDITLTCSST